MNHSLERRLREALTSLHWTYLDLSPGSFDTAEIDMVLRTVMPIIEADEAALTDRIVQLTSPK